MTAALLSDEARVQRSVLVSLSFHGLIFGSLIVHELNKPHDVNLVLTQVDFIDASSEPEPPAAPAMRRPRGIKDFLMMALPTIRPAAPQEGPREVETPKDIQMPKLPDVQKLVDKNTMLARGPSIRLDDRAVARSKAAAMADMAPTAAAPQTDLAAVEAPKTLDLEAVGRVAVRTAGPSIRIEANAAPASGARMREVAVAVPVPGAAAGPAGMREAGIKIQDSGGPARYGRALPSAGLPVGYGRGTGGISLAERPVGRGTGRGVLPVAPAPAPAPEKTVDEGVGKKKAMEISGPLAGRKILSLQLPVYPEWARAKGVEADVLIRFFVNPQGEVLERMIIERTSGYKGLDDICMEALKRMVFAPLAGGSSEDQWGIVTFRFRLK